MNAIEEYEAKKWIQKTLDGQAEKLILTQKINEDFFLEINAWPELDNKFFITSEIKKNNVTKFYRRLSFDFKSYEESALIEKTKSLQVFENVKMELDFLRFFAKSKLGVGK